MLHQQRAQLLLRDVQKSVGLGLARGCRRGCGGVRVEKLVLEELRDGGPFLGVSLKAALEDVEQRFVLCLGVPNDRNSNTKQQSCTVLGY